VDEVQPGSSIRIFQSWLYNRGFDDVHQQVGKLMLRTRSSVRTKLDVWAASHRNKSHSDLRPSPKPRMRTTFVVCSSDSAPEVLLPIDKILKVVTSNTGSGSMVLLVDKERQVVNESVAEIHRRIAEVQAMWRNYDGS
jgi:hypothetical protein